ncbi:MAG: carboxymuconolactone decarboxylase family protein [Gammaproteobacteria bacterium]
MTQETVQSVLDDWRTAQIDDKLKAALAYVEKLTLTPHELTGADIDALRDKGLSDKAIEEAAYVTYLFSVMDRLADTFDFDIPTRDQVSNTGKFLFKNGYKLVKLIR